MRFFSDDSFNLPGFRKTGHLWTSLDFYRNTNFQPGKRISGLQQLTDSDENGKNTKINRNTNLTKKATTSSNSKANSEHTPSVFQCKRYRHYSRWVGNRAGGGAKVIGSEAWGGHGQTAAKCGREKKNENTPPHYISSNSAESPDLPLKSSHY